MNPDGVAGSRQPNAPDAPSIVPTLFAAWERLDKKGRELLIEIAAMLVRD